MSKKPSKRSRLTAGDVDGFMRSASLRSGKNHPVIRKLEQEHPIRMASLRSSFRWFTRQLLKYGIPEDEARWLL